jgi:adenylate cyclase
MSETRKLAAILVADVVGYSRLAGADEDRILARLRTLRSDLIDPTIAIRSATDFPYDCCRNEGGIRRPP